MPIEIKMPALSPTMKEGKLISWLKKEGEKISPGEIIAEIETDKAIMELDTPFSGKLGKIFFKSGEIIAVGEVIALILKEDENKSLIKNYKPNKQVPLQEKTQEKKVETSIQVQIQKIDKIFISPLAKKIAEQKNIDCSKISGSGPRNRIVKSDIENFSQNLIPKNQQDKIIIPSRMRKTIANRLTESKQTIPHFYLKIKAQMDDLLKIRESINSEKQTKISINDFIIKATAIAMEKFPEINSSWQDEKIIQYGNIDISVAVSISDGLITPIIRNANQKSIFQISDEIKILAQKARDGKLQSDEYIGGGITISNMGMYGISEFSAIINPPQAAILAIGAIEDAICIINEKISPKKICTIIISVDHRIIDGSKAAEFGNYLKKLLENPGLILI